MNDYMNLLDFLLMILATVSPIYLALKVGTVNRKLLGLALLLASFTFIHSLYHLFEFIHMGFVAEAVFWPLGAVLLLAFGIYYWRTGI